MRIATWNPESSKKLSPERERAFRQAMAKVNADVWVLTETWVDFAPGEGFQVVAESSAADDLKPWPDRRWVAIWAKSSLAAKQQQVHSQPDRMACGRIETPGQKDTVVVGTVLPWFNDKLWPGADGFCAALANQVAEWGTLWGTPGTCTFVIAGDFNQSLPLQTNFGSAKGEFALLNTLKRHDLFCLTPGNDLLTGKPRIDHICVSRNGLQPPFLPQVGEWAIPCIGEEAITDHAGVFADLQLLDFP